MGTSSDSEQKKEGNDKQEEKDENNEEKKTEDNNENKQEDNGGEKEGEEEDKKEPKKDVKKEEEQIKEDDDDEEEEESKKEKDEINNIEKLDIIDIDKDKDLDNNEEKENKQQNENKKKEEKEPSLSVDSKDDNFFTKLIFSKYKPIKKLGEGSFGKVYKAEYNSQYYAIKFEDREDGQDLLQNEATIMSYLKGNPHIPKVRSYGFKGNYNILVMQLLDKSLEDIFNIRKKILK